MSENGNQIRNLAAVIVAWKANGLEENEILEKMKSGIWIIKKTTTVNGIAQTSFPFNGKDFKEEVDRLQAEFKNNQGIYSALGISEEDAKAAGWHPDDNDFHGCDGFKKALKENFKITKTVEIEPVKIT